LLLPEAVSNVGDRIRIRRIRMFLGLPDPDPLVKGTDQDPEDPAPDPSLFSLKKGVGSGVGS
jgi:hypothetical protein